MSGRVSAESTDEGDKTRGVAGECRQIHGKKKSYEDLRNAGSCIRQKRVYYREKTVRPGREQCVDNVPTER